MIDEFGRQTISRELEQSCADEAIRIIGTVQPHGFVLVAEVRTARILQVSSGIARHWPAVGEPARLLGARLSDWVDGLGGDPSGVLSALPATAPAVVSLRPRAGAASVFECVGHRMGDAAVLEWQPLGDGATQAADETRGMSEMRAAIIRLRSPKLLDPFFVACVAEVGRICGFDRIMLYKFLPDWSGEVIAEHVAHPRPLRFLGLRFPASDIPSQARALYTENKIRVLADVQAVPDTLVPAHLSGGARLDQSHCLLRGFSDVHRTYLGNMHVRATMSLSIMCDDKLWGLIACHHYEPRIASHAVRTTLRQVCELIAEVVALRIEALTQVESTHNKLLLEHLMNRLHQALSLDESMEAVLDRLLPQLLLAFEADAFYATIGEVRYAGGHGGAVAARPEIFNEVAQLIESTPAPASVLQRVDLLALGRAPLATLPAAAGILAAQQFDDVLEICAFTRPEVAREVRWAGAPVKIAGTSPQGSIRLEPRRSFALWKEQVAGTAREWSRTEVEACERLLRILSDTRKRRAHSELQRTLTWRAHHDHLTGLFNRRALEDRLDERLRESGVDSALMLIDLDHFKTINDTKGHAVGDQLLKDLSRRLGSVIRPSDTLARVGGDEFMLLAHMIRPDPVVAVQMAGRLQDVLRAPFKLEGEAIQLSVSIGVAMTPTHGTNATDLMRRADLALYRAKKLGRSRSVVFDDEMELALIGAFEFERELQDAAANGQLSVAYQPEVDLRSGRVVALEALVRWTHPTRGAIAPAVFIPIAERTNLISQIGRWVVHSVIATQADWRARNRRSLQVAVNVSMPEVTSGELVGHIRGILQEFRMPAKCLAVELTESVIMSEPGIALKVLRDLQQMGITTALDDFGTGYSSLSYLRQLPLNSLKVDQSFTASLTHDSQSQSLTQAIIRMADALHMVTIAEGIETRGQLRWLIEHQCNIGQGYLFSHPVPAAAVHATVDRVEAAWRGLH